MVGGDHYLMHITPAQRNIIGCNAASLLSARGTGALHAIFDSEYSCHACRDLESRGDHTPLPHASAFDDDPLSLALVR